MKTAKKPKPKNLEKLYEIAVGSTVKVEREAGIIREVKVLGRVSRNNRTYSESAVRSAISLYEGAKVEINHDRSGAERPFEAMFGELRGVRMREGELFADLHFNREHSMAGTICEAAERFPKQFGLSHNAYCLKTYKGGETIIEEITAVDSVDIVSRPATSAGLFESEEPMKTTLAKIVEALPAGKGKDALKLFEGDYGEMEMEAPAEGMGADEQIKSAFRSMVMAAFDDDGLDSAATVAKIKEILKAQDKLTGKAEKPEGETEADPAVAESIKKEADAMSAKLQESIDKLAARLDAREAAEAASKKRGDARRLAESVGVEVDEDLVTTLVALPDEAAQKKLLAKLPAKGVGRKPLMESRFAASQGDGSTYEELNKNGFAAGLK